MSRKLFSIVLVRNFIFIFGILLASYVQANENYAVASAHPLATQAGIKILEDGGNAFDAAISVAAVLGVVEPYSAGLGGGGFWLLYDAEKKRYVMVDARERAPLSSTENMYQNSDGSVNRELATNGAKAAAIPGQAAAFAHLAKNYGKRSLKKVLKPAIHAANDGFKVEEVYQGMVESRLATLQKYESSASQFLSKNTVPSNDSKIKQPYLAHTLQQLAQDGHDGFYTGKVAKELVRSVRQAGGIWTEKDLTDYKIVERAPIQFNYKNAKIISASLPSSGGLLIASMMHMLEPYSLKELSSTQRVHLLTEIMKRGYRQRNAWLGDSDFVQVPYEKFLNKEFALNNMKDFNWKAASNLQPITIDKKQGEHTTHFSILDSYGNRVSATLSINLPFGSGFVAGKTGVLLNNEMDDFDAASQVANAYGFVGQGANKIEPGKRPLSSMSPTFIETDDWIGILGTPGGSRIISMVFHGILAALENKPVAEWVAQPRYHHQFLPNEIQFEPDAFSIDLQNSLKQIGHPISQIDLGYGNMHAIQMNLKTKKVIAASDPRKIGLAIVKN
ncbi:MAG: gamma-glutamyltransferase [Pseudomonadota bacterium]